MICISGVARGGAQEARAPPSALGLVNIVHRTASPSTPLATPNHQLLLKKQLRRQLKTYLIPRFGQNPLSLLAGHVQNAFSVIVWTSTFLFHKWAWWNFVHTYMYSTTPLPEILATPLCMYWVIYTDLLCKQSMLDMHNTCTCTWLVFLLCVCVVQVRAYCESQPRYKGKSWMELFPDDSFPNDTPEDKVKSNADSTCTYTYCHSRMTLPGCTCHVLSRVIPLGVPSFYYGNN
jgi:hypothetical protein